MGLGVVLGFVATRMGEIRLLEDGDETTRVLARATLSVTNDEFMDEEHKKIRLEAAKLKVKSAT